MLRNALVCSECTSTEINYLNLNSNHNKLRLRSHINLRYFKFSVNHEEISIVCQYLLGWVDYCQVLIHKHYILVLNQTLHALE